MKIVVAGYGKFGRLAVSRFLEVPDIELVTIVDPVIVNPMHSKSRRIVFVEADIVDFLTRNAIEPESLIIPTAPFHVAASYFTRMYSSFQLAKIDPNLIRTLPNVYVLDESNVCCSYADFLCPDDCNESESCTVTHEIREPMYKKLSRFNGGEAHVQVLRSEQALAGVGGYSMRALEDSVRKASSKDSLAFVTACRCHAFITGIESIRSCETQSNTALT